MRLSELYADKATRNARVKVLKASGMKVYTSTVTNQRISPCFLQDSNVPDTGLNNAYKTFYAKLFCIDEEW